MKRNKTIFAVALTALCGLGLAFAGPKENVIDEVAWVVGGEPIYLSEIEEQYAQMKSEGTPIAGDPYCVIPEQIALQKLYVNQAQLDSIIPPESAIMNSVEKRMNFFLANLGSKEKVEQYFNKPYNDLRDQIADIMRTNYMMERVQEKLTEDIKTTPNDVRKYFTALPADSVPDIPMQVEVQLIQINPEVPQQDIEDIKARLRNYADRVNKGEIDFSTLAIMYSEDPGSANQGGELGFRNKADFVPEFANVAFNLNDPKKVSRIVETEYGFHILQLIEKRGDQVNVRHILLTPRVSSDKLVESVNRLDSVRTKLNTKEEFEQAVYMISQDKDTRNNKGIMVNQKNGSTRFEMRDLPPEMARAISSMQPGDVSQPFIMKDERHNRDVVAMVRLKDRIDAHKASLSEDYNMIKEMYRAHEADEIIRKWVEEKIRSTYVRMSPGWDDCDFQYSGWKK